MIKAKGSLRFIFRHIARSMAKTLLVATVALAFTLALGFLRLTISNTEEQIDRLYATTFVEAEIRPNQSASADMWFEI